MKPINYNKLEERISAYNLPSVEDRLLREILLDTLDKFYKFDATHFRPIAVEQRQTIPLENTDLVIILDVLAEIIEPPPYLAKKGLVAGDLIIIDWKTTGLNLANTYGTSRFNAMYRESMQWKLYCTYAAANIKALLYRGISKEINGGFYELVVQPYPGMADDCALYLKNFTSVLDSYANNNGPWLKNIPHGCDKYDCSYIGSCQHGTPAEHIKPFVKPPHTSFSSIELFQICNERYRRTKMERMPDDSDDAARIGTIFHELIASVYADMIPSTSETN